MTIWACGFSDKSKRCLRVKCNREWRCSGFDDGKAAPKRVPGLKLIHEFPAGETVVAMTEFRGKILIATSNAVYHQTDDGKFGKLMVVDPVHGIALANDSDKDA